MAKRAKIGDLVEINTGVRLAYAQYTHRHPTLGALLRVFEGFYSERPEIADTILEHPVQFSAFFPLDYAIRKNIVQVAFAEHDIPAPLKRFPIFRTGMPSPETRKIEHWYTWDGESTHEIGRLSPEQARLPIRGTWNDTLLIERIEQGWRPEWQV